MASDYDAICDENQRRYGTDIGRIGPMLLADRYDDRTHFIFELLQNAEDALSKRESWHGARRVTFELKANSLVMSHFGRPFNEADVRGVCGIAESTKDKFSIGRFGIGFKSVYTLTDRPEIHSGDEAFVVENYVQPRHAATVEREPDETLIILPLKPHDETAQEEITKGFQHLGAGALLFLRHISEVRWSVQGGASGVYLRGDPETVGHHVQRITVIGQETGKPDIDQNWLVFHQEVFNNEVESVGRVQLAFAIVPTKDAPGRWSVQPVVTSHLVVFFPTVVSTNLGFLVQGPFRTTPSRDNIPRGEPWNQYLVKQAADLLVQSMRWLRDNAMLDTAALRSLPLDREKYSEGSMFAPLFEAVRTAFLQEELLPCFDGGYIAAPQAKLARTQDVRELFNPEQVASLLDSAGSTWLSGDITPDRAAEIRQYLITELRIQEITPMALVSRLNRKFLEAQSDDWVLRLYEFLNGQEAALRGRLDTLPLIRLKDGSHVVAREDNEAKAFLPSAIETSFPTMPRTVCATSKARSFLFSLGITEPDPVDDVVRNILPKYREPEVSIDDDAYAADIERILSAFDTDSKSQREKLLSALREATFVMVTNPSDGKGYIAKPDGIYLATDRLKQLFAGVPNTFIVDDRYACLRGEHVRELLEACGVVRYPRPDEAPRALSREERASLRRQTGHEETSGINDKVVDWILHGFSDLIALLPKLGPEQRADRARLIWESLGDLEERRGRGIFEGSYSWSHYGDRKTPPFPAAFLRQLNNASWVPDANGDLVLPKLVVFDALGWKPNPFLLSKIPFKPPLIDQLAKEAGIDPEALDLLRKLGITSVADLTSLLRIPSTPLESGTESDSGTKLEEDVPSGAQVIPAGVPDPNGNTGRTSNAGHGGGQGRFGATGHHGGTQGFGAPHGGSDDGNKAKRLPSQGESRSFISYVGVHPDEEDLDPDGIDRTARMQIEAQALKSIIDLEPTLHRTPESNPGFDLYEVDGEGNPCRWVEVKSMTGSLNDRPVGLSRTQFECAREHGTAYWLYIVEYATDLAEARILRIQDPVALARTFTFDRGWSQIAHTEPPNRSS